MIAGNPPEVKKENYYWRSRKQSYAATLHSCPKSSPTSIELEGIVRPVSHLRSASIWLRPISLSFIEK